MQPTKFFNDFSSRFRDIIEKRSRNSHLSYSCSSGFQTVGGLILGVYSTKVKSLADSTVAY